ncbi:T9SS type A sorting domain-containing protein [Flavobacterium wongokense]|uniref:T9SS type A sorting domain-containing protein n=1 Tax=Flavobacterium wongokense TaxID=2910674 RepID=UPI001F1B76EC|nr:T9SS type A sorting domain-containing protein [Flavobacterium sp. WG47]MCF6130833.1 T9SS type A sorting domain-containing protein [Flavobacterium sp. WG47]
MKKGLFVLLIILLAKSNLSAQHIPLAGDFEQYLYVSDEEIIFTIEVPSATISGEIQSAVCTTVTPSSTNVIIISDPENNKLGGSKGTVIRPRPGFGTGGKALNTNPKTDILLNQSYNDIQITSNSERIIGFSLYDLSGRLVIKEKTIPTNNYTIPATELKRAIYIVKIDLENQQSKTIKFIKN